MDSAKTLAPATVREHDAWMKKYSRTRLPLPADILTGSMASSLRDDLEVINGKSRPIPSFFCNYKRFVHVFKT